MPTNYPTSLDNDSSLLQAADLAISTLTTPMAIGATTISLADASPFPATGGIVKIDNELIKYTGKTGNDLTGATRGYSGTTAAAHPSGSEVRLVVSKDYHNNLKDAIVALETQLQGNNGRGINVAVTQGATSIAITFGTPLSDANYGVAVTPNWNTSVWVTGKTATGFTINFGTAAPAGATVDWMIRR